MSIVVYRGPSTLDPTVNIVGIVTFDSANTKTGKMAQLFILRADMAPHHAQKQGLDAAVCGDCPQRPSLGGNCYVKVFQSPRSTWQANLTAEVDIDKACAKLALTRASLRLGAYGDPAALPAEVIARLASSVQHRITGYTHQWKNPAFAYLKAYVMASADSPADMARAYAEGWRTFRVSGDNPVLADHEILCPSERVHCIDCRLCSGKRTDIVDKRKSIVIPEH